MKANLLISKKSVLKAGCIFYFYPLRVIYFHSLRERDRKCTPQISISVFKVSERVRNKIIIFIITNSVSKQLFIKVETPFHKKCWSRTKMRFSP